MYFYDWLMRQKARDNVIGDLANDAEVDKLFPREAIDKNILRQHLINNNASVEAREALELAMNEYLASEKREICPKCGDDTTDIPFCHCD